MICSYAMGILLSDGHNVRRRRRAIVVDIDPRHGASLTIFRADAVTPCDTHGQSTASAAPLTTPLARARRRLMRRRLPLFAIGWLATTLVWVLVLVVESRSVVVPGVVTFAGQLLLLVAVAAGTRRSPTDDGVRALLVIACIALGASSTLLFTVAGGGAEPLAFVLLTLFVAAALLFAWGWRAELVVVVATLVLAAAALPFI